MIGTFLNASLANKTLKKSMLVNQNIQNKEQHAPSGGVKMDAEVAFYVNGNMVITPSPWEAEKRVACRQVKGRMTVERDGVSHFKAYRENTGRLYDTLMETANGALMKTRASKQRSREKLVVKLSIPLSIGAVRISEALMQQVEEMLAYIKTH